MNSNLIERLQKEFPGHAVSANTNINPKTFKPRLQITIDGKTISGTWNTELMQELKALHGLSVEEVIFQIMVDTIREELRRALYPKWLEKHESLRLHQ